MKQQGHHLLQSTLRTLAAGSLLISSMSYATPFETCPSKAYLFQSNPVQVYGVNLVTGNTTLLQSDTGISANINAVGFDYNNRYIYGYDTTNKQLVRLGKDFQAEILEAVGLPSHTFFVGDVFDDHYYLYRQGKGLFKVDLSPLKEDPDTVLLVEKISSLASVRLTDFAFHPQDEQLYGIDNRSGYLFRFDTSTGQATSIGDTDITGTFGAGYFDVNGYYYVSRNEDGFIYRIDLSSQERLEQGSVTAVKFADGPASSQNDGARCANAPIIDEDSRIDFGDAPDSYQTRLASNGPRHQLDGQTYLGFRQPDGEQDAPIAPLSDNSAGLNDESGVGFVTAFEPGLDSILNVTASQTGYLSAWFDWNQDGDFADEGERMFRDRLLAPGSNTLLLTVPLQAQNGQTWSRFRFSQQQGLDYFGGAQSGEVEDHPITITSEGITVRHFPGEGEFATLAYEDNWPYTADYDMNDVVMHYRITEILRDGIVEKSLIQGRLAAIGADYHNGFAVRLPGLKRSSIDTMMTRQLHNGIQQAASGLEQDSDEAIFIISEDLSAYRGTQCRFYRTLRNCKENERFGFELHISIQSPPSENDLMALPYDPFIFATPGFYHGDGLPLHPGRQWEVHLADQAPTEQFNRDLLLNQGADASDPSQGVFFKTHNNLPWALLITQEWLWPAEREDLVQAYPEFADYAQSAGARNKTWHRIDKSVAEKIYK